MGMEPGGRASKLGDTYERLWAVRHSLLVMEGRFQSLLWEPFGEDEPGIDLWVVENDGHRIGHQLKRQNRNKEYWSVADLLSEGILQAARLQLERDCRAEYVFVSSCGARSIRDLTERARRDHVDANIFLNEHVNTEQGRTEDFKRLMSAWGLDPTNNKDVARAYHLLQRMTFEVFERTRRARMEVEHIAGLQVDGDPTTIVATIGDLLDNNLGRVFHANELRQYLQSHGLQFRRLAGDPSLPAAIERLQDRFDRAIRPRLIAGVSIDRPESADIVKRILGGTPPRVLFVHGSAGMGKSVVLHQAFVELRRRGIPVLPIQLHTTRPEGSPNSFGRTKCELPASPALALRALAGERRAVVMFDQLDSLRFTSVHSHAAWQAFSDLVDDALADGAITVVIACRSFDLDNDPNISAWRRAVGGDDTGIAEIRVGELSESEAVSIVEPFGVKLADLPERQRILLRQPNCLALWYTLAESGNVLSNFDNSTQLMRQFIKTCRTEAARDYELPESEIGQALSTLVSYLDRKGRLDAPVALFGDSPSVIDALRSVGLLTQEDGVLTFAHQSYFDHLVAERILAEAIREGRDALDWVKANQSLFRRDQLRQLLTLLRECDHARHEALLRAILLGEGIRFHLKHLVLGLLRQADPVLDHEARLVHEMYLDADWRDHVLSNVIRARSPWFNALDHSGALVKWLSDGEDDQRVRDTLRFFRSVAEPCGERIDELLAPHWEAEGRWADLLLETLSFNPCDDSPCMFDLRVRKVQSGELAFNDVFIEELAKQSPERLVKLVGAAISLWVRQVRDCMRSTDEKDDPSWPFRNRRLVPSVLNAVRDSARVSWDVFADPLQTIERLEQIENRRLDRVSASERLSWHFRHSMDEPRRFIERLVVAAAEGMVQADPKGFIRVLDSLPARQQRGLERPITKGLAAGPREIADRAIEWLCERPARFSLGDGHHEIYWEPARALIARFAAHCSDAIFARLESAICAYHDEWEPTSFKRQLDDLRQGHLRANAWGCAQNVLLSALPEDRMSQEAESRAANWRAKFGDPSQERPTAALARGGTVTSPIPPDKLMFVSDRDWLRIIRTEWSRREDCRWRQHGPDLVGEASLRQFADALGTAARTNPKRFAALALRIPPDADPAYFTALIRALTDSNPSQDVRDWVPASVADLEAIFEHVGECRSREFILALCRAIGKRDDGRWSDRTIETITSYAEHPDPAPEEFSMRSRMSDGEASVADVALTAINCVRGVVASTIATLMWRRPDAHDRFWPPARRLLSDPHPSVRYEALGICLPVWNRNRDLAIDLAMSACEHRDDRVLGSRWLNRLIDHARATHLDKLIPVIERMAKSSEAEVAEAGAMWATAAWLGAGECKSLVDACRVGSKAQRLGVAEAAAGYFASDVEAENTHDLLAAMFDDVEPDVRARGAGVFRRTDVLAIDEAVRLAMRFVQSSAFRDDPRELLIPLSEYTGDTVRYAQAIFGASDVLAGPLAAETRDLRGANALAGDELSTLLLRLYEHTYGTDNRDLQDQCLDRWDAMLQNQVGMSESHLRLLDA